MARGSGRPLSLEYLTLSGPDAPQAPELLTIAESVGCDYVSLFLWSAPKLGIPALDDDPRIIRETLARSASTGVSVRHVEGFTTRPGSDESDLRRKAELAATLGARAMTGPVMEFHDGRAVDDFAALCALASEFGMEVLLEFFPFSAVKTVGEAAEFVVRSGAPNARVTVDTLHLQRSGGSPADVARIDPSLIGLVQISDAELSAPSDEAYWQEALYERRLPGEGALPLVELLEALPEELVIGVEVPQRSLIDRGATLLERARVVVDATRAVAARAAPGA